MKSKSKRISPSEGSQSQNNPLSKKASIQPPLYRNRIGGHLLTNGRSKVKTQIANGAIRTPTKRKLCNAVWRMRTMKCCL